MSGMIDNYLPFRVVKGTEENVLRKTQKNGYVYFATDTGRIYMDTEVENKLPMGGGANSGIFYAKKKFVDPTDLTFSIDDITTKELPNVNDLVINVSADIGGDIERDGFYQVVEVITTENKVITNYLPVGGGGSNSGNATQGFAAIEYVTPSSGLDSTLIGEDYYIDYNLIAQDSSGSTVINPGTATWIVNGKSISGGQVKPGLNKSINFKEHLSAQKEINTIKLSISILTGGNVATIISKVWQITAIDLQLKWDFIFPTIIKENNFKISFVPYGNTKCKAHLVFDDDYENPKKSKTLEIAASGTGKVQYFENIELMEHGSHKARMWLEATIDEVPYRTEDIINEIVCVHQNNILPIITIDYNNNLVTQWDTIEVPFSVISTSQSEALEVDILINNDSVLKKSYSVNQLHTFSYTLGTSGLINLRFESGNAEVREIELTVTPLLLEGVIEPASAYKLAASELNDNLDLQKDEYKLKFYSSTDPNETNESFDWENGGYQTGTDEEGNVVKYICIKNGDRMKIQYELFGNEGNTNGKVFKIAFKATNCYDYEAPVLRCYDDETNIGIKLNAQSASFNSGTEIINTAYCEDSYIEFEAEIWPKGSGSNVERYMMIWVDGVPVAVRPYGSTDTFKQKNKQYIEIGSENCDVHVYLVKIYERQLNSEEHLDNFIVDAPAAKEKKSRYDRNNILDASGEISYEKLVKNNPGCHAYLYEVDKMTTGTDKDKDMVTCNYTEYYNDPDNIYLQSTGALLRAQGTSSAAYGVAAFNLRTDFKKSGLYDGEGNPVVGRKCSETSIPINYACTKVNVASCENANNVLNQEWYNRFQPYHDAHRRKVRTDGALYRDCMEFDFGVVFIKDNNKNKVFNDAASYLQANVFSDTPGYEGQYYKQYSIANMGNDKKNTEVFHDESNPLACCVEIANNQTEKQWMTQEIDMSEFDSTVNYEFRYPDGNDKATETMKQNWVRFVNWMANNNPNAATGQKLTIPEEERAFDPYTFKGFDPPGYEGHENPTGVSLKDVVISDYEGIYTHDTFEYRMAKMLNECEDYLVMDSVVYHYLFIQRHTMVDNVAKNTFWSTEDGKHWDLTKNYDNDTSDGNDNSGNLVFGYGIEIGDIQNDKSIFNAPNAVWLNFIKGLPEAQEALYQKLSNKGAWDSNSYLQLFKEKQSLIPERCWIYDYDRKYLRPRRIGLDETTYLKRLDGGRKTHQRKQYEVYQDYYLNSKYLSGTAFNESTAIDSRFNSPVGSAWDTTLEIPVKYYIDLYPSALIGTTGGKNTWRNRERLKRGDVGKIPVGKIISNPQDSTAYIFGASMIQELSNLADLYPSYLKLNDARRLRKLEIGKNEIGYKNTSFSGADLGKSNMLEYVYLQNLGSDDGIGELNLTEKKSLKILDTRGSSYTSVIFAENGLVEEAYINGVSTIDMRKLSQLRVLEFDENIYTNLKKLYVDNCPIIDTKDLVINCPLTDYLLLGIDWTINENTLDANNNLKNIDILDKIDTLIAANGSSKTSISGKIHVDLNQDFNVDEFEIYEKYQSKFPNVAISYNVKNGELKKATKIIFRKDDTEDSEILYTVLTDGTKTLEKLISASGPTGEPMSEPNKSKDAINEYYWNVNSSDGFLNDEFYSSEDWQDTSTNKKYTHQDLLKMILPSHLDREHPTDIEFKPIFSVKKRKYKVIIKDEDGTIVQEYPEVSYNTTLTEVPFYMYKPHSNEAKRYEFKGWITADDFLSGNSNPQIISDFTITSDLSLYAYYKEQSIMEPSSSNYFLFEDGKTISLNPKYRYLIQEPITLPLYSDKNKQVKITKVGNFGVYNDQLNDKIVKIPAVYFENSGIGGAYDTIANQAFWSATEGDFEGSRLLLKEIHLPSTIKTIGQDAFKGCAELETIELPDATQENIGITSIKNGAFSTTGKINITSENLQKLTEIGVSAFYYAGSGVYVDKLPNNLEISAWSFAGCPNVSVSDFTNITYIGSKAFYESGGNKILDIILPTNISNYQANCFDRYAINKINTVTYLGGTQVEDTVLTNLGLSYSNPTTIEQVME